jgi:hypothetical protein
MRNPDLIPLSYSGTHDGVRYSCSLARYGKGMVLALERENPDGWKDRASWLAEGLNGRWARGHQPGWRMSPTRATQWLKLYLGGYTANVPMFKSADKPVTFSRGDGPNMTLKEALAAVGNSPHSE